MAISELVRAAGSGPQGQSLAIAVVGLYLAGLLALALLVRRRWPEQREWSRKLVHIGTGPVVLLAWALQIERGIALPAAAAAGWAGQNRANSTVIEAP